MGRKAMYFTFQEKMEAARRHKALYARSERPRTISEDLHDLQASSLFQCSTFSLPDSHLFHQSLAGSNLIDESDLSQWDKAPPYDLPTPPDSLEEDRFMQNLVDVMHGHHLRAERELRTRRTAMYNMGQISEVLEEI
ncbi:hypothetical protein DFH29DRAFT_1003607 [Suillus ampliporus]|nr:hypothetical protein DFH29DRAFT_1003607 [Suillus ampliporus]